MGGKFSFNRPIVGIAELDSSLKITFFLIAHLMQIVISLVIVILSLSLTLSTGFQVRSRTCAHLLKKDSLLLRVFFTDGHFQLNKNTHLEHRTRRVLPLLSFPKSIIHWWLFSSPPCQQVPNLGAVVQTPWVSDKTNLEPLPNITNVEKQSVPQVIFSRWFGENGIFCQGLTRKVADSKDVKNKLPKGSQEELQ